MTESRPRFFPPQAFTLAAALCLAALLPGCASAPSSRLAAEWYEIGNGWYDQGKWAKAGEAYSRAVALDPGLRAASYNLSRALAESGDYEAALAAIEGVLAREPGNIRGLSAKAYILYKKGDIKAATAAYEKVHALDPYAADAVYNLAFLREADKDWQGALDLLGPALVGKPDDQGLALLNARALAGSGKSAEALDAFEKLKSSGKLAPEDLEKLSLLYEGKREYAKAIEALASCVAADSSRAPAWFRLAQLRLAQAEDGKGGLEALQKALELGFKDEAAIADLLAEPSLAEREAVLKALADKGLGQ
jgi:tetratricopeptide (TPR) repeat protein